MYVPIIPHTSATVINKTIVYSDTVLPLKDSGNHLKVTSISDVDVYSLERCLEIIFRSNPNVVFNTIQYSRSEKKVYFYTDTEISKQAWNDSKFFTYAPLTSGTEILEEAKRVLSAEKNKDADCISLYDVAQLMKARNCQYEALKENYQSSLNIQINYKYHDTGIVVHDFDYDKKELRISFRYFRDYDTICFTKRNGDLFITKSESTRGTEVLAALGECLSILYDKFMEFEGFRTQSNCGFKPVNSNFLVDVNRFGVSILVRNQLNRFKEDFKLTSYSYQYDWGYDCNSSTVVSAFKGKESEIFKRIFVRISDCPEWSQPILYGMRQNLLAEEQRWEEEKRERERKHQKRLAAARKMFPFLGNPKNS